MFKNTRKTLFPILSFLAILSGCRTDKEAGNKEATQIQYQTIAASTAQDMMDKETDLTILDVRTESEYASGHIPNAILLPYDQITSKAEAILPNKEAKLLVYCRSGRRSAIASKELASLGYRNVYDFGGLNNWPNQLTVN